MFLFVDARQQLIALFLYCSTALTGIPSSVIRWNVSSTDLDEKPTTKANFAGLRPFRTVVTRARNETGILSAIYLWKKYFFQPHVTGVLYCKGNQLLLRFMPKSALFHGPRGRVELSTEATDYFSFGVSTLTCSTFRGVLKNFVTLVQSHHVMRLSHLVVTVESPCT